MPNVLMTLCSYDDPAVAERDAETLRSAGIQANVVPCLYEDPENPGVPLVDLVVFDTDVQRSQEVLQLLPREWGTDDADSIRSQRVLVRLWAMLIVVIAAMVAVGLLSFP